MPTEYDDQLTEELAVTLARGGNELRSVGGLAREVQKPRSVVEQVLRSRKDLFEEAPIRPAGRPIYHLQPGIAEQYRQRTIPQE